MTTISPDDIKIQLGNILDSPGFKSGQRLNQFLRYVVEQTLNGRSSHIKQYTVAVEALGFGAGFDPQSNPTVRIHAQKLRRALDRYYHRQGHDDPIRIEMPKGSYVPVFKANHTTPVPPGVPECDSPDAAPTSLDHSKPTIAVMMFDCLNANEEINYIATGLTEEIIIALTQFPDFKVVGPLDRDVIERQKLDTQGIGQRHRVRFLLNGGVRVYDEMFRLTVRLTDTLDGQQLWGQVLNFNMKNGSMLALQDDMVGQVTAIIADSHGIIPRTLTKESSAGHTYNRSIYESVLRYYHHFRVLTPESFVNAMNALEKSVRDNPDHALSKGALSDLLASSYLFGHDDNSSILERAEMLARKAVALDSNCQVAHWGMALVFFLRFQRRLFLNEAKLAIRLNPNNTLFVAAASLHIAMVGEWELAMKMIGKAMRLNPHHPKWYHFLPFMNYYRQGEYDRAWVEAQHFNTQGFFWDPLIRAAVLGKLERRTDAQKEVDELLTLLPDFNRSGPDLIRRLTFLNEHVEMLLDGLRKAGLEIKKIENKKSGLLSPSLMQFNL
jgi:adenylate cyclase